MTAYWIGNITVLDKEKYAQYARIASEIIIKHEGVCLALGGTHIQLEGLERSRNVVAQFPNLRSARKCYNSKKYQRALNLAKGSFKRDVVIVEGIN
tara:strand:- start:213 stop:500 length:288 start_codon:yes stop_codon:yes gene_type:complete